MCHEYGFEVYVVACSEGVSVQNIVFGVIEDTLFVFRSPDLPEHVMGFHAEFDTISYPGPKLT